MKPPKKIVSSDKHLEKTLQELMGDIYSRLGNVEGGLSSQAQQLLGLQQATGVTPGGGVTAPPPVALNPPGVITACSVTASFQDVLLVWTLPTYVDDKGNKVVDRVEIWSSLTDNVATATLDGIAKIPVNSYLLYIGVGGVTKYVWLRCIGVDETIGPWYPTSSTTGITCTTLLIGATDIDSFAITASKLFLNIPVIVGDPWHNNTPGAGSISWDAHQLYFNGVQYNITASNTNLKYVYWTGLASSYGVNAVNPADATLLDPKNGFIIAVNLSGVVNLAWRSVANEVIGTAYIMNAAITNAKINDLSADKIDAGTLLARPVKSASTGDRVMIFPTANIGLQVIGGGANVLLAMVGTELGFDAGDVVIGDYVATKGVWWDQSTGTLYIKGALSGAGAGSMVPGKYYSHLLAVNPSMSLLTITADWLSVKNPSAPTNVNTITGVNQTNDTTISGPIAGGRDTSASFTGWIYFYIIYRSYDGLVSSVSSASATSPTMPDPGDGHGAYDRWMRVCARWSASVPFYPNLMIQMYTVDEKTYCNSIFSNRFITLGNPAVADTLESLSIPTYVPPTAKTLFGLLGTSGLNRIGICIASDSTGINQTLGACVGALTVTGYPINDAFFVDVPLFTSQTIWWTGSSTTVTNAMLELTGWIDDI